MLVYGDFTEVLLDRIKDLLYLCLWGLLEEHLAQEISERMHHQLMEGRVLEEKLVEYIFNELWWSWVLLLRQPGHILCDLLLQHLTARLVSRKDKRFLNQVLAPIFITLKIVIVTYCLLNYEFHVVCVLLTLLAGHWRVLRWATTATIDWRIPPIEVHEAIWRDVRHVV